MQIYAWGKHSSQESVSLFQTTVKALQVKEQEEVISKKNIEIQAAMHRKEIVLKELAKSEFQCTTLQHNVSKHQAEEKECKNKVCNISLFLLYKIAKIKIKKIV